jgi:CelD/BcsL family acetyltransferase involved in cellulose biosynthesis
MELKLHSTFPQEIRSDWNRLVEHNHTQVPFLDFDYLRVWWETRGGGEWPGASLALVTACEDGRLVGVGPFFHTADHQGQPRLMLLGSIEVSDYLDVIVEQGRLQEFTDALLPFLAQADLPAWSSIDLYNLFETSPTPGALQTAAGRAGWTYQSQRVYHCPYIPLPGDWETYLAGIDKKQRHEIRRKLRRLETADVSCRWYLVEDAAGLDAEYDAFVRLMEQDEEKVNFLTQPMREFFRSVVHWAFDKGILHLAFLEIDGKKAATYLAFDLLNHLWVYNSGISREYYEYSPGWVLLSYQLQWANEQKRAAFDFMRGDEEYKYRFGGIDRYLLRATLSK